MARQVYRATVPGSCMLLGEYAVLEGHPAIVVAVDRTLSVTLRTREDQSIHIRSSLGELFCDLKYIPDDPPFQFIARAIQSCHPLQTGFDLTIESNFSHTIGLGSSAAVTVATLACLFRLLERIFTPQELLIRARKVIQDVQGLGSGADVAASIYGGVTLYAIDAPMKRLYIDQPLHLLYTGYKTPTVTAVKQVYEKFKEDPEKLQDIYKSIAQCVRLATQSIALCKWKRLGLMMRLHQVFLDRLGVSDTTLKDLLQQVNQYTSVSGVKISGSGLGDCLILLGELPPNTFPRNAEEKAAGIQQLDIRIAEHGLEIDEWTE